MGADLKFEGVRNAEAAGSNPARSTTFNASYSVSLLNSNSFQSNTREILVNPRMLEEFEEFMRVNMRLEARTALDTRSTLVARIEFSIILGKVEIAILIAFT
jgi:hypothetical protein